MSKHAVPYKLDFDGVTQPGTLPRYKMGRGGAGWTVAEFDTAEEAAAFAATVPACARFPHPDIPYNRTK